MHEYIAVRLSQGPSSSRLQSHGLLSTVIEISSIPDLVIAKDPLDLRNTFPQRLATVNRFDRFNPVLVSL